MREPNLITSDAATFQPDDIVVGGAPWDLGSSYSRGSALAPARIREALFSAAGNLTTESGLDLSTETGIRWCDDLDLPPERGGLDIIERWVERVVGAQARPLTLGGDHSITQATIAPVSQRFPGLTVLQIDAHPDLYDEFEGDRQSHACPMARVLETGRVGRLIQIGVRASTPHQRLQVERFGVESPPPDQWSAPALERFDIEGPVYLTLDLDGLDPAFAPGVSHPEPGGLSARDVIEIIRNLPGDLVGADLVELNPQLDLRNLTAVLAAKLCKEIVARMLRGPD